MQNNTPWKSELKMLAAIISKQPLQKTIKWGSEVFTFNGKNVVSYGGFKNLTPGKQKEYIVYINEAKQDQTKLNRLEKIKPMILKGIGLNDRYR